MARLPSFGPYSPTSPSLTPDLDAPSRSVWRASASPTARDAASFSGRLWSVPSRLGPWPVSHSGSWPTFCCSTVSRCPMRRGPSSPMPHSGSSPPFRCSLPTTVLQGALQARLRFFEVNAVQSLGTAIGQLLPLSVALLGHTQLSALVPAVLVSRLVVVTLLLQQCGRHVPLSWTPTYDRTDVIELARYGGWVSVVTFLAPMLVTIDRLVIATMSGAASVTAYTVPYDLSSRVMVVSGSLSSALFPRLALATPAKSADLATRTTKLLTAVMTPLVLVGMLGVKPFLDMWLGPTLAAPSSGVAEIILVGVWVNALVIPHGTRLLAVGNPRTVAFIYLAQLPVYISLLTLGLKYWGILGAAVAWTTRVLMDTCMLLRVGGELGRTIRMSIPYAILVVSALLIVLLVELNACDATRYWRCAAEFELGQGSSPTKNGPRLLAFRTNLGPTSISP
jgi:hypothetical protein